MNINLFVALFFAVGLSILCNGDFINKFLENPAERENEDREGVLGMKHNSILFVDPNWTDSILDDRLSNSDVRLKRNKRGTNKTDSQIAYRVTDADKSKNNSNSVSSVTSSNYTKHALLVENFKRLWPIQQWRDIGYFTDDYLDIINEHWLTFPPPSKTWQKVLGSFYLVFYSAGLMGNVIVLIMYFRMNLSSSLKAFREKWPVKLWNEHGLFTDEYLFSINEHWLQFPPPANELNYMLGGLYFVLMLIGCSGNAVVLTMFLRCRTLRTPGNILVANLALSDFCMLVKTPIFIYNSFNFGPALGKTFCVIYGFVGGLTGTTSIATLAAIALDRYYAVVRPLEPLRSLTTVRARLFAVGAWIYATIFASIPALDIGYGHYVPEGYLTSCSFDYLTDEVPPRYFIFVFFCAAWVAPFCTISFCYLNILRVVIFNRNIAAKKQEQRLSSRHIKEQAKRKAEVKLAVLVIVVIALFFISWTPYAVVSLLGIFGEKRLITPIASMLPALFCKTAACINPFIYIMNHPTFRKELRKVLTGKGSKRMGGGTIRSTAITETTRTRSKDLSATDPDVEIVQMKDIPFQNDPNENVGNIKTISSKVSENESSRRSISMKSFEENVVTPPSWYAKPKFAKKKSFRKRSTKSIISLNTEISI